MEHHVTCLANVAVYGPVVDRLLSRFIPGPGELIISSNCPGFCYMPGLVSPGELIISSNCPGFCYMPGLVSPGELIISSNCPGFCYMPGLVSPDELIISSNCPGFCRLPDLVVALFPVEIYVGGFTLQNKCSIHVLNWL